MHRFYLLALSAAALLATAAKAQPPVSMDQGRSHPEAGPVASGGPMIGRRFAAMDADADGDGKVTHQEFIAFQDRAFERIDVKHRGQIDKADLDAAIAQAQLRQAGRLTRGGGALEGGGERQLTQLSNQLEQGGVITREMWERRAAKRFERLDAAHLGYLTPNKVRAAPRTQDSDS